MWRNKLPRLDVLPEEQLEAIHGLAMTLLEEIGVRIGHRPAVELLTEAGLSAEEDVVRFDRGFVAEKLALAPSAFEVRGRNPERTVTLGGDNVVLAPTGGAPFVLDLAGKRRPPTVADYIDLVRASQAAPHLHVATSGIVEPDDLPVASRCLDMDRMVLRYSDKPYFANGVDASTSADCADLAAVVFGGREEIERSPVFLGIVNPVSPLQYDDRMAGSLVEFARAGQPVVLMPFVITGGTAPLDLAGALAQTAAEVLAGVAMVQTVRPETPCVYGTFVAEMDLHGGAPIFGTGGSAVAMLGAGQLARRYGLPFRGGGAFTDSPAPDVRAAQESLMSLWPTMLSGANLVLHAVGWLEGSLETSLEKFAQDLEPLDAFERLLGASLEADEEERVLEAFREAGPGGTFLGTAQTLRAVKAGAWRPARAPGEAFGSWERLLESYEDPGLDPAVDEELDAFLARRKEQIAGE